MLRLAALLSTACSTYVSPPDAGATDDGSIAAPEGDARAPADAGFIEPPDATSPVDASTPCVCVAGSVCEAAACVDGVCVRGAARDGLSCAEDGSALCVAGACVPRGCGDGFREPGPDPAREACDDGNDVSGDACSPACTPTLLTVEARAGERDDPLGPSPSIGIDGMGRALVVWRAATADGVELRGRRYSASGVPLGPLDPLELSEPIGSGVTLSASVAGLDEGWVVTWDAPDGDGDMSGVLFRLVAPDGRLSLPLIASVERHLDQRAPRVAAVNDGFIITWEDRSQIVAGGPHVRVRQRRFSASGSAISAELAVSSVPGLPHASPALIGLGARHVIAWVDLSAGLPGLRVRRFEGDAALDTEDVRVVETAASEPAIASLESGTVVIAWRDSSVDPYGDIAARTMSESSELGEVLWMASSTPPFGPRTTQWGPSIVELGADDFLIAYHEWTTERGASVVVSPGATEPPELPMLRAHLDGSSLGHISVVRRVQALWWTWSDVGGGEDDLAERSVRAMPVSVR